MWRLGKNSMHCHNILLVFLLQVRGAGRDGSWGGNPVSGVNMLWLRSWTGETRVLLWRTFSAGTLLFGEFAGEAFCPTDPDAVAFALESRGVGVIMNYIFHFGLGEFRLIFGEIKFGKLNFGASIGMPGGDLLPDFQGGILFTERSQGFGQRHQRVAVIMFVVLGTNAFQEGTGFGGALQAKQRLTEMGPGIDVPGIALQGSAVTSLGFLEFALTEIDIAKLEMMDGIIEMMNLGFKFLDALALGSAWEFEALGGGARIAVDHEKIEESAENRKEKDKYGPDIFAITEGVNTHPELKKGD
jgi:hypothetical protein